MTNLMPVNAVRVDEPSEFRALAERTTARCIREAEQTAELNRAERQAAKERRAERRRIARNVKLLCLGMIATCCGISAVLISRASYPALAVFPAALALLSLWQGVKS